MFFPKHIVTLDEFFSESKKQELSRISDALIKLGYKASIWIDYEGGEVEPFSIYVRWSDKSVTVANITCENPDKGRLPSIIKALENHGDIFFENVINERLAKRLKKEGFVLLDDELTYIKYRV